ncbi:MAG: IS630 transposase-related protein [Defluviitaleaceae bacterium]|nr:IS630 transposase-related protein [Defluviitaleaceae bacterium]
MAHDIQIRTRAVELLDEGYTQEEVSKLLKVGTTSIKRWSAEIRVNGSIRHYYDTSNRTASKLPEGRLLEHYKGDPDALLKETAQVFDCDPSAVFYACKRYKISLKKDKIL